MSSEDRASREESKGRPRLLVLNEYYWPGVEATAHLLTELCESLADEYEITVVTGTVSDAPAPEVVERNGVRIVRVASTTFDRSRLSLRAANYLTYSVLSLGAAARARRPDLVLVMTDPPFLGVVAYAVARRFRVPLVVISQDVFPEIAVELGRLRLRPLVGLLGLLVAFYLRRADAIVAIGTTMRERLVAKGVAHETIDVIPNWIDVDAITPRPKVNHWSRSHDLADKFVVMHSGNVGHAQDLDSLLRAATMLRDLDNLRIVITGSGARRTELGSLAERLELDRVVFFPYQPRGVLPEALATADVHVVGLASGLSGFVVPSRLYGILAAGRPVIVAADAASETAHVALETGAGIVVPPGKPYELALAIRAAHSGELDLVSMGLRGREYAEREAARGIAVHRYRVLLRTVRAKCAPLGDN